VRKGEFEERPGFCAAPAQQPARSSVHSMVLRLDWRVVVVDHRFHAILQARDRRRRGCNAGTLMESEVTEEAQGGQLAFRRVGFVAAGAGGGREGW